MKREEDKRKEKERERKKHKKKTKGTLQQPVRRGVSLVCPRSSSRRARRARRRRRRARRRRWRAASTAAAPKTTVRGARERDVGLRLASRHARRLGLGGRRLGVASSLRRGLMRVVCCVASRARRSAGRRRADERRNGAIHGRVVDDAHGSQRRGMARFSAILALLGKYMSTESG